METSSFDNINAETDWKKKFLSQDQRMILSYCQLFYATSLNSSKSDKHNLRKNKNLQQLREFLGSVLLAGHPIEDRNAREIAQKFGQKTDNVSNLSAITRKEWNMLTHAIKKMDGVHLRKIVYFVCQSKTLEEKEALLNGLLTKELWNQKQRQIQTAQVVRNLALFGAIVTLGIGSANADTRKQMAQTMMETAAITALATGAHIEAKKRRDRHNEEVGMLKNYHPDTYRRLQQIQRIMQ